jgi:hypothetical protein
MTIVRAPADRQLDLLRHPSAGSVTTSRRNVSARWMTDAAYPAGPVLRADDAIANKVDAQENHAL